MRFWLAALFLVVFAVPPVVAADDLQETLLAREKAHWTAWGNKDSGPMRKQTVENYVQVIAGFGMTMGREAVAKSTETHDCVLKSFEFADAKLRHPAPEVAILTYVATQDTSCGGQKLPKKVFVSSTFVKSGGEWVGFQYQETPID